MDKAELIKLLRSKEVKDALKDSDVSTEELFSEIEVSDGDTPETIAKKFNDQLKRIVTGFRKELGETKKSAVDEALAPTVAAKQQEILDFQKANPGMSNKDVIGIMDPLYQSGKSLKDAYQIACKALGLSPDTGLAPEDGVKDKKEEKKTEKQEATSKKSSLKSAEIADVEEVADKGEKKEAKTLAEVIAENANKMNAETGNPFDEK